MAISVCVTLNTKIIKVLTSGYAKGKPGCKAKSCAIVLFRSEFMLFFTVHFLWLSKIPCKSNTRVLARISSYKHPFRRIEISRLVKQLHSPLQTLDHPFDQSRKHNNSKKNVSDLSEMISSPHCKFCYVTLSSPGTRLSNINVVILVYGPPPCVSREVFGKLKKSYDPWKIFLFTCSSRSK